MSILLPSPIYAPIDDSPTDMSTWIAGNRKPARWQLMQMLVSAVNTLAMMPRVHANLVSISIPAVYTAPSALVRYARTRYWDGRTNSKALIGNWLGVPDQKFSALGVATDGELRLVAEDAAIVSIAIGSGDPADRAMPSRLYSVGGRNPETVLTGAPQDIDLDMVDTTVIATTVADERLQRLDTDVDVCIDPSRYRLNGQILDTDILDLIRKVDRLLYDYRPNLFAFCSRNPNDPTTGSSTSSTSTANLLTGGVMAYSATGVGYPLFTRACARGKAANATVRCFVLASCSNADSTGTVRLETQAGSVEISGITTTHQWWPASGDGAQLLALADGSGDATHQAYGDWCQIGGRVGLASTTLRVTAAVGYLSGDT